MTFRPKPIIFDVTRLIRRGHFSVPTGIDRIERQYAEYLLNQNIRPVTFEAWLPVFGWQSLSRSAVKTLIDSSNNIWANGTVGGSFLRSISHLFRSKFSAKTLLHAAAIRLTVAHNRPKAMQQWRAQSDIGGDKICYFVHDLIPIEYPEFARPRHARLNVDRMATAVQIADGLIVNSDATRKSLEKFCREPTPPPPILVAPFGMTLPPAMSPQLPGTFPSFDRPYFLCVGTIEPRKNHLLLLDIWRNMSDMLPRDQIPWLVIAGRRGWQNDEIIYAVRKCIDDCVPVTEINDVSDGDLAQMMNGACALLMPSFAEGFGLPVAEALNAGCPVIASDIPAHREVGGKAPLFLQADDAASWQSAILNFASDGSAVREEYKHAAARWRPYDWDAHFAALENFLDEL
jgi:glycosyltransferase involved in cell wall biosynthesis